jgi:hypothetical protein
VSSHPATDPVRAARYRRRSAAEFLSFVGCRTKSSHGGRALDIHDEIRVVKPGLYLGRAYFRGEFGLNFTLVKPQGAPSAEVPTDVHASCLTRALISNP